MNLSLRARLLIGASITLTAFLGLTGAALDRAFRASAERALQDRLQAQVYSLLAAAELDPAGSLQLPEQLPETRYSRPRSGLYAVVLDTRGNRVWTSPSLLGVELPVPARAHTGRWIRQRLTGPDLATNALGLTIDWEDGRGGNHGFTITVAEDVSELNDQVTSFRHSLWVWLGAAAGVLLLVQVGILGWGLSPLRRAERELTAVENGRQEQLGGQYPPELRGLTDNINGLIRHQRSHLERYRNALGDLAHSLKTPLAVVRGVASHPGLAPDLARDLGEQVERMVTLVDYQLQKAAASGSSPFATPIPVAEHVTKIAATLDKVYADKAPRIEIDIEPETCFRGDTGDLMEMLGNVLDNAYKWCRSAVRVSARPFDSARTRQRGGLLLVVEDDGPGVPEEQSQAVLERGRRADATTPGHGIGLAVVRELSTAYGGELAIDRSVLGGARITVRFPASA